jgi:hypothetical protein
MRRGVARPAQDAAGRLLEDAGDRIPREMTVRVQDRARSGIRQNPAYRPAAGAQNPLASRASLIRILAAVAALVAVAAVGCVPPQPGPSPTSGGAHPAHANAPNAAPHVLPHYVSGHFVYDIESVGVISSRRDTTRHAGAIATHSAPRDTTSHPDTVVTHSVLTYDGRWQGEQLQIFGQVAYRITATPGVQAPTTPAARSTPVKPPDAASTQGSPPSASAGSAPQGDTVPVEAGRVSFEFDVDTATGIVHNTTDSAAVPGCPPGGPAAEQGEALASDRPRSFVVGTDWSDTLTKVSCLSGIPITTRTTRLFHVASANTPDPVSGAQSIEITNESDVTWDGEARRQADLVTIHATGSGTTERYYDHTSGVLLSAHTQVSFDLDDAVNGRSQHLHQAADWRAQLRAGR